MQRASVKNPLTLEILAAKCQALIALPKNGSFSRVFDKNEGLLTRTSRSSNDPGFHSSSGKLGSMKACGIVVAQACVGATLQQRRCMR